MIIPDSLTRRKLLIKILVRHKLDKKTLCQYWGPHWEIYCPIYNIQCNHCDGVSAYDKIKNAKAALLEFDCEDLLEDLL